MQNERAKLAAQASKLRKQVKSFPRGKLLCVKNGPYIKWFKSNGSSPIYIPKKNRKLAESLAAKKFYSLQHAELLQEIKLLDQYLEQHKKLVVKSETLLEDSSCYKELLQAHFQMDIQKLQQWSEEEYDRNTSHPENLVHKTISGQMVRSKSEVIIANSLFLNQIPYRYECGLQCEGMTIYPDFTICHPKTKQLLYWEHFGMMDRQLYCENAFTKLKTYANQGIIPSIQLITTYETQNCPIDSSKIQQIIEEYFLS